MPSLKEIKGRIGSVQSTLKITSAMKLVASAKLRKAQQTIEGMRPYERKLQGMLDHLVASGAKVSGEYTRTPADYQKLADKPSYAPAAELAEKLMADFLAGRLDRIDLVYNHFVSSGKQVPVRETLLPMSSAISSGAEGEVEKSEIDYILEPSASALLADLLPKSLRLKFYTALLDSNASEHAARTVAMQTATDNGEDLLQELTLQYNKSRQQKITSEILDLAGGSQQQ